MDPITQRILEQQRAITQNPNFSGYQPSVSSLDQDIMNLQTPPSGIASIQAAPVNQEMMIQAAPVNQEMMIQDTFVEDKPIDFKGAAQTAAKKMATNYAMKKLGIDGLAGNVLGSVIGGGLASLNPIALFTMGSTLPNPVKGIAGYLRNKRAQKEYQRSENMLEAKILSNIMAQQAASMQGTPEGNKDAAMGGGNIPTKTSAPKSSGATSNPYSGGAGGIHSGY